MLYALRLLLALATLASPARASHAGLQDTMRTDTTCTDTTWTRVELQAQRPGNQIVRDGVPWPKGIGYPLYDSATRPTAIDTLRRSSPVGRVPDALHDTLTMAAIVSRAPDNDILVLAGRTQPDAPWTIYLDRDNDNAFSANDALFTATSDDDNGGAPHKAARGSATARYDVREGGTVITRELPVEIIWVQNNAGIASTRRFDRPLFLFNAETAFRRGSLPLDEDPLPMALRTPRDGYGTGFDGYVEVLIDRNGDGQFDVSDGSSERYERDESFIVDGRSWRVDRVDADGEWVEFSSVPAGEDARPSRASQPGDPAPSWRGRTLTGDTLRSAEFADRYVLLDFWASWCSPCIQEIPTLRQVHERYGDDAFALVGIATQDTEASVRRVVDRREVTWPIVFDEDREIASAFRVLGLPDPILIGPDGRVVERGDALRGDSLFDTLDRYLDAP